MAAAALALLAAALAAAGGTEPAPEEPARSVEAQREKIRTSLRDLDKALSPLEDLTAAYAAAGAPAGAAQRGALRDRVALESTRLNKAYDAFWSVWDLVRLAQGARLLGGLASGAHKPEEGAAFLDDSGIDDFKAETKRMQERAAAALAREDAAYQAFEERQRARRVDRLLAAGAAVAALGAALHAWLRADPAAPPRA